MYSYAIIDGEYRYSLTRRWDEGPTVCWIMLNPSTADAVKDDPTIRRCIGFSKREKFGEMIVVNLYALRASNPKQLRTHPNPLGPDNLLYCTEAMLKSDLTICAWGAICPKGSPQDIVAYLVEVAKNWHIPLRCLGTTKHGHPRHPLYVPANKALEVWA